MERRPGRLRSGIYFFRGHNVSVTYDPKVNAYHIGGHPLVKMLKANQINPGEFTKKKQTQADQAKER